VIEMDRDAEHLRLLALFHYIKGGITALISCFFIIYIIMGVVFTVVGTTMPGKDAPPAAIGLIFVFLGAVIVGTGWTIGGLTLYAGRCLTERKHRTFCMVVAALNCLFIPYGTILGVFTLVVLLRPSVMQMFSSPLPPR
jgi:hypothetical protein